MEGTYWNGDGKYQAQADEYEKLIPGTGQAEPASPIEFLRLATNAYYDMYNNGFGNADIRLAPLIGQLPVMNQFGVFDHEADFTSVTVDLETYWDEKTEAQDTYDRDDHVDSDHLHEPMEKLMNAVVFFCTRFDDPAKSLIVKPDR